MELRPDHTRARKDDPRVALHKREGSPRKSGVPEGGGGGAVAANVAKRKGVNDTVFQ